jgi:cytidylate kinase
LKCDGTHGMGKGKLANAVGSQYSSHYLVTWCIQYYYR